MRKAAADQPRSDLTSRSEGPFMRLRNRGLVRVDSEHLLLLKGLLLWAVVAVACSAPGTSACCSACGATTRPGCRSRSRSCSSRVALRGSWHLQLVARPQPGRRGASRDHSPPPRPGRRSTERCQGLHRPVHRRCTPRRASAALGWRSIRAWCSRRSRPSCGLVTSSTGSSPTCCSRSACSAR